MNITNLKKRINLILKKIIKKILRIDRKRKSPIQKENIAFDIQNKNNEKSINEARIINIIENSFEYLETRTIGGEYICFEMIKRLGLPEILKEVGLREEQIKLSLLTIIGRLIKPSNENIAREWAQEESGIDELLETDFRNINKNAVYLINDTLNKYKEKIKIKLRENEKKLFRIGEVRNNFWETYTNKTEKGDLTEEEIWEIYINLSKVEADFKFLMSNFEKPELHRKKGKTAEYLFISELAYYILISIQNQLRSANIIHDWCQIVKLMKQERVTASYMQENGIKVYEKQCVNATEFQTLIYTTLNLKTTPLERKKAVISQKLSIE